MSVDHSMLLLPMHTFLVEEKQPGEHLCDSAPEGVDFFSIDSS